MRPSRLGLAVRPLAPEEKRQAETDGDLLVEDVDGPAAAAGVRPGDIILGVNGKPVKSLDELKSAAKKRSWQSRRAADRARQRADLRAGAGRLSSVSRRLRSGLSSECACRRSWPASRCLDGCRGIAILRSVLERDRCHAMRLLLIEDDLQAAEYLVKGLRENGYTVEHSADGRDGLAKATQRDWDVIIADRQLPHVDGLAIIGRLREQGDRTPVLILSALGTVDDRVHGLRAGGDDYLTKPFAFSELLARIEALSRRASASQ